MPALRGILGIAEFEQRRRLAQLVQLRRVVAVAVELRVLGERGRRLEAASEQIARRLVARRQHDHVVGVHLGVRRGGQRDQRLLVLEAEVGAFEEAVEVVGEDCVGIHEYHALVVLDVPKMQ